MSTNCSHATPCIVRFKKGCIVEYTIKFFSNIVRCTGHDNSMRIYSGYRMLTLNYYSFHGPWLEVFTAQFWTMTTVILNHKICAVCQSK